MPKTCNEHNNTTAPTHLHSGCRRHSHCGYDRTDNRHQSDFQLTVGLKTKSHPNESSNRAPQLLFGVPNSETIMRIR